MPYFEELRLIIRIAMAAWAAQYVFNPVENMVRFLFFNRRITKYTIS